MSNIKRTYALILHAWKPLLLFEIIYKLFGSFFLIPLVGFIFKFGTSHSTVKYVSIFNIRAIFSSPLLVVCLLLMGFLVTMYTFIEIAGIIICLNQVKNNEELRIDSFLKHTLYQVFWIFRPKNIILLITGMILMPLSSLTFSSSALGNFRIPVFIAAELHPPLLYVYWGFELLVFLFALLFIFVFHCFFLDRKNAITSFKEAYKLNSRHMFRTFFSMMFINIVTMVILFLISAALIVGLIFILLETGVVTTGMGIYSVYKSSFSCSSFVYKTFCIITSYAFLTLKFYDYKQENGQWSPRFYDENEVIGRRVNTAILVPVVFTCIYITGCTNFSIYNNSELNNTTERDDLMVVAHRGDAAHAPENTLPAIKGAIKAGADYAEIDVQLTKDNVVVLTHDTNLSRVTGQNVDVNKISYADLQRLDASMGEAKYAGTKIPSLDRVIQTSSGRIKLLIELKPAPGTEETLVKAVIKVIRARHFEKQCAIHSLSYDVLELMKHYAPDIQCAYCTPFIQGDYLSLDAADFFTVEQTYVTESQIQKAKEHGKQIWLWTVDDPDEMQHCVDIKAGGIITNDPETAVSYKTITTNLDQIFYDFCCSLDMGTKNEVDKSE